MVSSNSGSSLALSPSAVSLLYGRCRCVQGTAALSCGGGAVPLVRVSFWVGGLSTMPVPTHLYAKPNAIIMHTMTPSASLQVILLLP